MSNEKDNQYLLRNRPPSEKLVDVGFKNLAVILASMVAVVLFLILIVVFQGSLESMGRYGWQFLITSDWNHQQAVEVWERYAYNFTVLTYVKTII